jgi:hypothetical protein
MIKTKANKGEIEIKQRWDIYLIDVPETILQAALKQHNYKFWLSLKLVHGIIHHRYKHNTLILNIEILLILPGYL